MMENKRLIDANEIEELFYKQVEYGATDLIDAFEDALQDAQTVDAVEVVRCKDCKHGVWNEYEQLWQCVYSADFDEETGEYFGFAEYRKGEHFCSQGERRDGE